MKQKVQSSSAVESSKLYMSVSKFLSQKWLVQLVIAVTTRLLAVC